MVEDRGSQLNLRAGDGEVAAADELLPLLYDELHALAESCMRSERSPHTLQPTALLHETYLRLVGQSSVAVHGRNHFFILAAQVMRRILVDHARGRDRLKRGGDWRRVTIESVERSIAADAVPAEDEVDLLRLHDALDRLAEQDPRKARLVELRFFAGFGLDESASILGVARSTASDDWRMARAWLRHQLRRRGEDGQ